MVNSSVFRHVFIILSSHPIEEMLKILKMYSECISHLSCHRGGHIARNLGGGKEGRKIVVVGKLS